MILNQFLGTGFLIDNSIYLNPTHQVTFTAIEFSVMDPEEEQFDPCVRLLTHSIQSCHVRVFLDVFTLGEKNPTNFKIISQQVIWITFSIY